MKWKKCEKLPSLQILDNLMGQNQSVVENKEQKNQKIKLSFLGNLSTWDSMYISEESMSLFDFEDWVGSCWESG